MILLQALMVGAIGYGLGRRHRHAVWLPDRNTELSFRLPWQLLLITAAR